MPSKTLEQIAEIQYGYPFDSKLFNSKGETRVIRIRDIKGTIQPTYYSGGYEEQYTVQNGDIIVGMDGEFNCRIWDEGSAILNQRVAKISPKLSLTDKMYFLYSLRTKLKELEEQTTFVTVKHLLDPQLRGVVFDLPPIGLQKKVGSILEKSENLRQKREEAIQLSLRIIRSVFLKMFGDRIPHDKIDDVVEFVSSGSTPLGGEKTYVADGIVFIRSQNVLMNELQLDDVAHITEQFHNQMRRTWVKDGDVLLNITGASMGRVAFYRGPDDKANVNQHVCIIRLNKKKALSEYISYYLSSSNAQKQIWTIQAGASRQALNFKQVRSLSLYLPPLSEQQKFATIVRKAKDIRDIQTQSAIQIDQLFHSLMNKAFREGLSLKAREN